MDCIDRGVSAWAFARDATVENVRNQPGSMLKFYKAWQFQQILVRMYQPKAPCFGIMDPVRVEFLTCSQHVAVLMFYKVANSGEV